MHCIVHRHTVGDAWGSLIRRPAELHGMSHVAQQCGLSSESMRRQLNGTRPLYFDSVLGVMRALRIQLRVEASA
ncbi:hypothetical protein [Stenotrophomonas lacuserhaii]